MLRRLGSCGVGLGVSERHRLGFVGYVDRERFVVYCLKLEPPIGLSRLLLLLANDVACLHCLTTPDLGCGWGLPVPRVWGLRGLTSHLSSRYFRNSYVDLWALPVQFRSVKLWRQKDLSLRSCARYSQLPVSRMLPGKWRQSTQTHLFGYHRSATSPANIHDCHLVSFPRPPASCLYSETH